MPYMWRNGGNLMPLISVVDAAMLYKVTNKTIYNWINQDQIPEENHLYDLDRLQASYDRRKLHK